MWVFFWLEFEKILSYLKSAPLNLSNHKIFRKNKNAYLGIFDQKCLIWVFLGKNFKETIVIFETSTLKFTYLRNFTKKPNCLSVEQKMPDLCIFGLAFENSIVTFEISILEFT